DGNNISNSLLYGCSKMGINIAVATPEGYECDGVVTERSIADAKKIGSDVIITNDPDEAIHNADVVVTDTWVSMGQEAEKQERIKVFGNYQVSVDRMAKAKDDAIFLHCLPAYRGYEVVPEVIDGPQSVIFDEAGNRLHAQKAVMVACMAD
ncbi:MAG: ornithine carbamoyltransferase, partial [Clostridia bacterium]|nr:ornithine carbamoyltransferase [Clostridia bacterium]